MIVNREDGVKLLEGHLIYPGRIRVKSCVRLCRSVKLKEYERMEIQVYAKVW